MTFHIDSFDKDINKILRILRNYGKEYAGMCKLKNKSITLRAIFAAYRTDCIWSPWA